VHDLDAHKGQRIRLKQLHLKVGWNSVALKWVNYYSTNRVGLHTFVDQED